MEGLSEMSDQEFADWLRSVPREITPEEVERVERDRDRERGPYVPHHHKVYRDESRH